MDKESGMLATVGAEVLLNVGDNGSTFGTTDYLLPYNQMFIIKYALRPVCLKAQFRKVSFSEVHCSHDSLTRKGFKIK